MKTIRCFECGGLVPDIEGAVSSQVYMPQSPGCWKLYGEVLAREQGEWGYPLVHNLTVDCYAVQHHGAQSRQGAQSVTVHLLRIYLMLVQGYSAERATGAMQTLLGQRREFEWLEPPDSLGDITIVDIQPGRAHCVGGEVGAGYVGCVETTSRGH